MSQLLAALRRRVRSGSGSARTLSGGVAALVALPVLVLAARGDGLPVDRVEMSGGGAWLASPSQGLVTLIDGPSEQVVGSLPAPGARAGDALSVVQSGPSAFVLNATRGTVSRVDGGTYEAATPVRFAEGGDGLSAFVGGSGLYVVDAGRRVASLTDPASLRVREQLSLAAQPGPGQAVVDEAGRLWVVDRAGGGLTWFDSDGKHVRSDVGDARSRLVLVQGRPVLVDLARPRVSRLSDDGAVEGWSCLDVRAGDEAELLGSAGSGRVLAAVSATGTLVSAGVDGDDCDVAVPVGRPGDRFGPLVEASGFVFVPNRSTGRTSVVDLAGRQVVADLDLKVRAGSRIELLAKDGLVFYNDLDGDRAGVIRFDGRRWVLGKALQKYNRAEKGEGILTPAGDAPTPAPNPTPRPGSRPTPAPSTTPPGDPGGRPPVTDPGPDPAPDPNPAPDPDPAPDPNPPDPGPPVVPDPGPGPGGNPDPTTAPPGPKAPVIRSLTWAPRVVVREQPATFTAKVDNAAGATWSWSILDPATGRTLHQAGTTGSMTHTLPAGTPDAVQVRLAVSGPGGEAKPVVRPVTTTSSRTPQVTVTCPATAGVGQAVGCSGQDPVAGADGDWSWTVTGPGGTVGPTQAPALQDRTFTPEAAGTYTVTLKVTYDGVSDEKSATVTVSDQCALTAVTASPVDVRAAARIVQVQLADCFTTQTVTIQRAGWLASPSGSSVAVAPGGTASVSVSAAGPPPVDGVNNGALTFGLANGRAVSFDVAGNRAPEIIPTAALPGGYTACVAVDPVQFLASYRDADLDSLVVTLEVAGRSLTLQGGSPAPTLFAGYLAKSALPPSVTSWRVRATDRWGESSPWTQGSDQWNCW